MTNEMTHRISITEDVDDYLITLINDCNTGMGLRIKAGTPETNTTISSNAILSVADKHNDNKFIVKSNGNVVSYYNHTIGDIFIEQNRIGTLSSEPIELKTPIILRRYTKNLLPQLSHAYAGSVVSIEDENFKPAYYDGTDWRYFRDDEVVK